ncbi:MAG: hypothetical protein IK076_07465, partial [Bacteroidales bacterium]|nr:hypothetical protein [Bacteroidales bacterium]
MKTRNYYPLFLLIALTAVVSSSRTAEDPRQIDSFTNAVPVWAEGRQTEKNLTLAFREVINAGLSTRSEIRIAAS